MAVETLVAEQLSLQELRAAWQVLSPADRAAGFALLPHAAAEDLFLTLNSRDQAELLLALDTGVRRSWVRLLPVPVVDAERHVKGIVTVDDIVDVVREAATEDIQKIGGTEALEAPYLRISLTHMIRKRAGWLSALFLGEMLTATAMGYFEIEIAKAVVLALFVPLIISSGGNSGSQATSLIIRSLALRELRLRDWRRVFRREISSGIALGSLLGAIGFLPILLLELL